MRKSRFSEEQIIFVLRQAEAGVPVVELVLRPKSTAPGWDQVLHHRPDHLGDLLHRAVEGSSLPAARLDDKRVARL